MLCTYYLHTLTCSNNTGTYVCFFQSHIIKHYSSEIYDKSGLTMVFCEKCLSQVYNLCLHNVWSLHPSYVCKVMTFSAHTLSIKLLTLYICVHTHTHTYTSTLSLCCNQWSSDTGVIIIFMVFFWYPASGGQCCVMRRHLWEDATLCSNIQVKVEQK